MDRTEFDGLVDQSAAITDPESTAQATLETLGESLSSGQVDAVARWLPAEYEAVLSSSDGPAKTLSYEEFIDRVCEREAASGVDRDGDVRERVGAVADALATTVPYDDLLDLHSQLPERVGSLFTEDQGVR